MQTTAGFIIRRNAAAGFIITGTGVFCFYQSDGLADGLAADTISSLVMKKARGRTNWIIGAGGDETAATLSRMYEKGFSGPLWEYLIR